MPFFEIFLLALALSMDAFAVAIASGIQLCQASMRQYFRLAFHFGLFQAIMPIVGWWLGRSVHHYIAAWDHYVAFTLLAIVGGNMIKEAFASEDTPTAQNDPTKGFSLVILAVATSIDALAVGASLAMIETEIALPALVTGIVCTMLTACGLKLGCIAGQGTRLASKANLIGGSVLLAIGVNILHEHGVF